MTQRFPKPPAELNRLEEGRFRRLLEAALGQASTKITNVTITQIGGTNLGGALDGDTIRYVTATGKWTRSAFLKNFDTHVTVGTDPGGTGIFRVGGAIRQNSTHFVTLGTITGSVLARDDSATWNNAGVAFIGWRFSLTNTASAVGSKMVDWAIGGTTRFSFQPITGSSVAMLSLTAGNNTPALNLFTNYVTGAGSSESSMVVQATMNTTGNPSLFYVNLVNAGGFGTSTQLMRAAVDGSTLFGVTATGTVGLAGGPTSDVWVRIGAGGSGLNVEEGLQVSPTLTNLAGLSHWVVSIYGAGAAGSAYTTPTVHSLLIGGYAKHTNQTITTWYGLKIEAGPAATTKWAIYTDNSARIGGDLVVTGTITGTLGSGFAALNDLSDVVITAAATGEYLRYDGANWVDATIAEADITDGTLLGRLAANESVTGAWTFAPSAAATAITVTQAVGGRGLVVTGGTQTTNQPALELTQTWNNAAVAFRGIELDVTDTASLFPAATLIRLRRNGASLFEVLTDGYTILGNAYNGYSGLSIVASGTATPATELWFENYGNTGGNAGGIFGYVAGGTSVAHAQTPSGILQMLVIAGAGHDGTTDFVTGARCRILKTTGAWTTSNRGSYFEWWPVAAGTTPGALAMTLTDLGALVVAASDPGGDALLRVGGSARVNTTAGVGGDVAANVQLNLTPAVGNKGIVMVGATQTTNQPLLNLAQTWNAGGVTFEAVSIALTNTASASGSSVLIGTVGGSTVFAVNKTGGVSIGGALTTGRAFDISAAFLVPTNGSFAKVMEIEATFDSTVTSFAFGLHLAFGTQAASFTVGDLRHIMISDFAKGSGSSVTTQYGIYINSLANAGTNYAIWVNNDINLQAGVLRMAGTQVLTTRRTGYTNPMTGTANRATSYDTSTITLQQLAERVKAIQDDLTTHGLIGA